MKTKQIALALGVSILLFQATVYAGVGNNIFAQKNKIPPH